jgi:hypothetical protein
MIIKKTLENGLIEVSSDSGMVDIGAGPVKAIIISEDELEYVSEVK